MFRYSSSVNSKPGNYALYLKIRNIVVTDFINFTSLNIAIEFYQFYHSDFIQILHTSVFPVTMTPRPTESLAPRQAINIDIISINLEMWIQS